MNNLKVENLCKSYPLKKQKLEILDELHFTVESGSMIAITGPSGSGKSTLLNLLGGLDKPDRGKIFLGEVDLTRLSEEALSKIRSQKIGFIFQHHYLLADFNALENVAMPALVRSYRKKDAFKKAGVLLERVGLARRAEHRLGELSGGERQRVAIARSLINDPHLVLADEPTGNLDDQNAREVFLLLKKLCQEKRSSIVMVTHNEALSSLCQKKWHLENGKITHPESPLPHEASR